MMLGFFASLGVQVLADPQGNVGVAFNGSYAGVGDGVDAQGGIQFSLSTARNINSLRGGPALDLSGSGGPIGVDFSNTPGGPTTGTLTVGPGLGGRGSAFGHALRSDQDRRPARPASSPSRADRLIARRTSVINQLRSFLLF
jgi:hypothetical protein